MTVLATHVLHFDCDQVSLAQRCAYTAHPRKPSTSRRVLPGMSVETVHSPRGLRINIVLAREHTAPDVALCALAPALFAHLDEILGTGLGPLLPPFGLHPVPRRAGVFSSGG